MVTNKKKHKAKHKMIYGHFSIFIVLCIGDDQDASLVLRASNGGRLGTMIRLGTGIMSPAMISQDPMQVG